MSVLERRPPGVVKVQVCGQLENLQLEHLSTQSLAAAVEQRFEVRPPFVFVDREGRPFVTEEALRACADLGGTVLVKLADGVLHDFGRRVDQFKHLQWGFLADQLSAVRLDVESFRVDARTYRQGLDQERVMRESLEQEAARNVEELRDQLRAERLARDALLQALEGRVAERGALDRAQSDKVAGQLSTLQRQLQDAHHQLREERREREQSILGNCTSLDDLRHQLESELAEREGGALRLHRENAAAQVALEAVTNASKADLVDVRQQLGTLRQQLAAEQRERSGADSDALSALQEVQRSVSHEAGERQKEDAALLSRLRGLEESLENARAEARKALGEVNAQLSLSLEGCQERLSIQAQEIGNLHQHVDVLRKAMDQEMKSREGVDARVNRLAQDVGKRLDEETRTREMELATLSRSISDETDRRQDGDKKLGRLLAALEEGTGVDADLRAHEGKGFGVAVEQCRIAISEEKAERAEAQREFLDKLMHFKRVLEEEQRERAADREEVRAEIHAEVLELRAADEQEVRARRQMQEALDSSGLGDGEGRAARRAELAQTAEELRESMGREARHHEAVEASLSHRVAEIADVLTKAVERGGGKLQLGAGSGPSSPSHGLSQFSQHQTEQFVREAVAQMRAECLASSHSATSELRAALQQELRGTGESLSKLREDCKEAMQREIRARMDRDQALQDALDHEGSLRGQAVELLEAGYAEVQQGLETHTHEMHIEGTAPLPQGALTQSQPHAARDSPPGTTFQGAAAFHGSPVLQKRGNGMDRMSANVMLAPMAADGLRPYGGSLTGPAGPAYSGAMSVPAPGPKWN